MHRLLPPLLIGAALVAAFAMPTRADPPEKSEELIAAEKTVGSLSAPEQALFNALRHLLRPQFEADLFEGRRYRPAPLPSFETTSTEPFSRLEALRLWAVLASGLPLTTAADGHLRRMLDAPLPEAAGNLAPLAIEMLACRAAITRGDARSQDSLRRRAGMLFELAQAQTDVARDSADPRFFANQLWRAAITRAAHDLEIKLSTSLWEGDLRALIRAWNRQTGWAASEADAARDSLVGIAALSLALDAPAGLLASSTVSALERHKSVVAGMIEQWAADWQAASYSGARLMLLNTVADSFAPPRISGEVWRRNATMRALAFPDPRGVISARDGTMHQLGLSGRSWRRDDAAAAETAVAVVGLSGGLLRDGPGPLKAHNLASIGRFIYAFAVVHVSAERDFSDNFNLNVRYAIEDGCSFIERAQHEDGTFEGNRRSQPGNTAICILALLHGGYSREDPVIVNAMAAMLKQCDAFKSGVGTYNAGLVLMALQKFHQPEQEAAGLFSAEPGREFQRARAAVRRALPRQHTALLDELVDQLDRTMVTAPDGGWGYRPVNGRTGSSDNSTSQFAMLGYKAASSLGGDVAVETFRTEAARLIKQYVEVSAAPEVAFEHAPQRGRTVTQMKGAIKPGGWGYKAGRGDTMQMTAGGISSLVVCMDELRARGELDPRLEFEIARHVFGAELRLSSTFYTPDKLAANEGSAMRAGTDGSGTYYNLYSVERACEMAGISRLNGSVNWYEIGANALLSAQNGDGGWCAKPDETRDNAQLVNAAMGVLFLKRAALPVFTQHRPKERESEEEQPPKRPVTGNSKQE